MNRHKLKRNVSISGKNNRKTLRMDQSSDHGCWCETYFLIVIVEINLSARTQYKVGCRELLCFALCLSDFLCGITSYKVRAVRSIQKQHHMILYCTARDGKTLLR
jgi:hypothetical protein